MYIAVEGVIGVGKTTLVRMLKQVFDAQTLLEIFEENPFLSSFYADRARYAFQTQIFFLLSRYHQQRKEVTTCLGAGNHLIADYTFAKDSIFAEINLDGDELEMYYRVHEALAEKIPLPNLVVYLQASTDMLMHRIAKRDRPYERNMERDYINTLNHAYDSFFTKRRPFSVLQIETDDLDFVQYPEDFELIQNRIRQSLDLPPFQPELPLSEQTR